MTAKNKRIKSKILDAPIVNMTHGTTKLVSTGWTVQDDIAVIGAEVYVNAQLGSASLGEIGGFVQNASLSRAATMSQESEFARASNQANWLATATFNPAGIQRVSIMFPEGYAIDMDEGEIVNLLHEVISSAALDDSADFAAFAIIYYTDRS